MIGVLGMYDSTYSIILIFSLTVVQLHYSKICTVYFMFVELFSKIIYKSAFRLIELRDTTSLGYQINGLIYNYTLELQMSVIYKENSGDQPILCNGRRR